MISFELGGRSFEATPLDPEKSLDGFAKLSPVLAPILDGLSFRDDMTEDQLFEEVIKAVSKALAAFSGLPVFRPLFLPVYKVGITDAATGTTRMLPLTQLEKQVFTGRPDLLVGWLVAALQAEYASFLDERGRSTIADLASRFGFRLMPSATGQSGAS